MSPIGWTLAVTSIFCCFYLISTDARTHTNRHIRQAVPEYYLDVLVVTDYSVWKSWYDKANPEQDAKTRTNEALRNIRQYFTLVIKEVSDLYRSLKTKFRVKFNPVGFYIVENQDQVTTWTVRGADELVNASQAYSNFQSWLKDQQTLPSYDHALLFTGENLDTSDGGNTAGWGSIGTVCNANIPNYYSVSVVEDNGAFQSVFTTMHELGHSLNATHDGTNNRCSGSDRYVMASGSRTNDVTDANQRNVWFFSPCSSAQIDSYVQNTLKNTQGAACLQTALTQVDVPDVTGVIPGQLIDADTQCQRLYGPKSAFNFLGNLSNICLLLSCRDPTDDRGLRYWKRLPATGTTCGDGQWCEVGQCVGSPTAPSVPSCYRDQSNTINHRTCEEMTKVEPDLCYDTDVYQQCCQSCDKSDTRVPGCPYGDRYRGCRHELCNQISSNGRIQSYECCETCNFDMSTWTCMDDSIVDGMTCSKAVERWGYQQCYNSTLAFYCCATCERLRDSTRGRGCEYGNRLLNGCRAPAANDIRENCDTENCCDTCRAQITDSAGCTISLHSFLFFVLVLRPILDFGSIL
ncbi:A disintegrin and metalloproteinase with thrombospondin motifs 1-like [Littorina saxatilis]|uniref:Peptidase M12B domain-containing protein n=1 Tax=Littorina saxatilis TaxID=31220 RepID=A0AAN9B446_9CAEN